MNDKEKLKKLLFEFGVGFDEEWGNVFCREGNDRITGHNYFYVLFEFNDDGSFKEMGSWE